MFTVSASSAALKPNDTAPCAVTVRRIRREVTATSETGEIAHLELLLLPFSTRAHAPVSLTGVLAPFESELNKLENFGLTSYRYLHRQEKLLPRAIRKLQVARGFMVYEGLR